MNGEEVEENGKMECLEIGSQLKSKIENVQFQILNALRYHNHLIEEKKKEPADKSAEQLLLDSDLQEAKQEWENIKYKQRKLIRRLRQEYKTYQATVRNTSVNSAVKERKHHLSYAINRTRKQNLLPRRRISPIRSYENEPEITRSPSPLPIPENHPINPEDTNQNSFLFYFRLTTHENFTEMQKKRAERKRRSTVNPQFLYGNKGWDFLGPIVKRKRSSFLAHPPSPPNTRGRKKQEIIKKSVSPPATTNGNHSDKTIIDNRVSGFIPLLPTLKNLPPGLVIEPISPNNNPDSQRCIICKQPGALSLCEHCTNGFHMSCHNRPFARTPKQCPKCLRAKIKEDQLLACSSSSSSTSCSSPMSVDSNRSPTPEEILEKLQLKRECQEKRAELLAELTQLQNRHSELTVILKNQDEDKQRLTQINKSTEAKIDELIRFIENVKRIPVAEQVI
ncbi:unnamed protein product [Ceutorhynchus assimilis]|uniref:Zinc finger PHD-type domain-containing protein n=1 Tax=Ceutorhynchus assimilis TaxID=467358 RepID=A0A9N9MCI9_9CUCU|nr:unnamed protein product [Ceutorhynchus assimilis]